MRVTGGALRGRVFAAPPGIKTRPTSDRLRATIFDVLAHRLGIRFDECRVLDLFAGSGAMGIEALSRGASHCVFIEIAGNAAALIERNLHGLALSESARIMRRDACRPVKNPFPPGFDLVFADPPYRSDLAAMALQNAASHGWIKPDGVAVLEVAAQSRICLPEGFQMLDERERGASHILLARYRPGITASDNRQQEIN